MKKFIANLSGFLICVIIIYIAGLMVWGSFFRGDLSKNLNYRMGATGYTYTRLHEVEKHDSVDVIFLGSSHAYAGFDPRIFASHGYSSFNLGTSSQTPLQTEMLVNRHLAQLNPSVVVFEVYPYCFSSDGVESSADVIANSHLDKHTLSMAVNVSSMTTYNTLIYAFVKRLFSKEKPISEQLSLVRTTGNIRDSINYIPGGYMEKTRTRIDQDGMSKTSTSPRLSEKAILTDIDIIQTKEGKWNPRKNQVEAFERILAGLKEKNIRVVLVQTPINSRYYAMIKCNKEIDKYFASKSEYYNFNEIMPFDNEAEFVDYDHLNQVGVKKMNGALIEAAFKKK